MNDLTLKERLDQVEKDKASMVIAMDKSIAEIKYMIKASNRIPVPEGVEFRRGGSCYGLSLQNGNQELYYSHNDGIFKVCLRTANIFSTQHYLQPIKFEDIKVGDWIVSGTDEDQVELDDIWSYELIINRDSIDRDFGSQCWTDDGLLRSCYVDDNCDFYYKVVK